MFVDMCLENMKGGRGSCSPTFDELFPYNELNQNQNLYVYDDSFIARLTSVHGSHLDTPELSLGSALILWKTYWWGFLLFSLELNFKFCTCCCSSSLALSNCTLSEAGWMCGLMSDYVLLCLAPLESSVKDWLYFLRLTVLCVRFPRILLDR